MQDYEGDIPLRLESTVQVEADSPRGGPGGGIERGRLEPPEETFPLVLEPTGPSRPVEIVDAPPVDGLVIRRPEKKQTSRIGWPGLLISALVAVLVCLWLLQAVVTWAQSLASFQSWLSPVLYGAVALLLATVVTQVWKDYRRYRNLRRADGLRARLDAARDKPVPLSHADDILLRKDFREIIDRFLESGVITTKIRREVCEAMDEHAGASSSTSWVGAAGNRLLSDMDERVKSLIEYEARLIGISTALSPYGIFDSFIVLWRNSRLVLEIAEIYNVRPGKYGSYRLFRRVAINAFAAGLSDEAAQMLYSAYGPALVELASGGLTAAFDLLMKCGMMLAPFEPYSATVAVGVGGGGKAVSGAAGKAAAQVSGPLLQGILTGILTIRIGLAAQAECRILSMTRQQRKEECASVISIFITAFPFRRRKRPKSLSEPDIHAPA